MYKKCNIFWRRTYKLWKTILEKNYNNASRRHVYYAIKQVSTKTQSHIKNQFWNCVISSCLHHWLQWKRGSRPNLFSDNYIILTYLLYVSSSLYSVVAVLLYALLDLSAPQPQVKIIVYMCFMSILPLISFRGLNWNWHADESPPQQRYLVSTSTHNVYS